MKNFTKCSVQTLFFGTCLLFSVHAVNAQTFNPNLALRLQLTLDSLQALFPTTKAMSMAVYVPDQGVWKGASGISAVGVPATPDMEFQIGSNTKLFTAVTIMKLVETNVIHLEDHLSQWIPTYTNVDPNITVRQLLNHSSGVADLFSDAMMTFINANPTHIFTIPEVMSYVGPKASFAPGAGFLYSNTNYVLLGMVAESATGVHISKLIRDNVLTPLQMDSTFYDTKETVLGTIAHPWIQGVDKNAISHNAFNSAGGPAGSLYSTGAEMVQFYNAVFNNNFLTPASMTQLTNFLSPQNYGFGLYKYPSVVGRLLWGHGGVCPDYRSQTFYDPQMKVVVSGLSNSTPSAIDGSTAIMYKVLYDNLPAVAGTISGSAAVCQGQNSVTYTVPAISKATSYIWTLPSGATGVSSTNSITVNYGNLAASGNISVKGTNAFGNGLKSSLSITVNPLPAATISASGPTSVCQGNSVILSANPVGTYLWSTGATTSSINVSTGNTYSVSVTVNGCTKSASTQITVNPNPVLVSANPLQASVGSNVVISGTALSNVQSITFNGVNAPFSGNLSNQVTASVPVGATSGNIVVTNTSGCSGFLSGFQVVASQACAKPVISPASGNYSDPFSVTITCSTPGSTIYYTTAGNSPIVGTSYTKVYNGSFQQIQDGTIKAMAVAPGFSNSALASTVYTITNPGIVIKPVITPTSGSYSGAQMVSITSATPNAALYYTTNGTTPMPNQNVYTKLYTGPFQINATTAVKCIGTKAGILNSDMAYNYITITSPSPTAATPVISPAAGNYATSQLVTLNCTTPGSTIYYTLTGNTPVVGTGFTLVYSGGFMVSATTTIRAMAVAPGFLNSAVGVSYISIGAGRESVDVMQTSSTGTNGSLYPNPVENVFNLEFPSVLENARIEVVNLLGQSVLELNRDQISKESVSVQTVPSGIYLVKISATGFSKEIRMVKK
jgi:CubicO group peptidase (beta-lactamase class C family)